MTVKFKKVNAFFCRPHLNLNRTHVRTDKLTAGVMKEIIHVSGCSHEVSCCVIVKLYIYEKKNGFGLQRKLFGKDVFFSSWNIPLLL